MSTSAIIGILTGLDSFEYIIVRKDGSPTATGELLLRYYNSSKKTEQLLSLGNIASLDDNLADCIAYNEPKTIVKSDAAQILQTCMKETRKYIVSVYKVENFQ